MKAQVEIAGEFVHALQIPPGDTIAFGRSFCEFKLTYLAWPGAEQLHAKHVGSTISAWYLDRDWRDLPMPAILAEQGVSIRARLVPVGSEGQALTIRNGQ